MSILGTIRRIKNNLFPLRHFSAKWALRDKVCFGRRAFSVRSAFEGKNAVFANASVVDCEIGLCTYISNDTHLDRTKIGRYCSIADHVRTGFGTHPTHTVVSTFPSFYYDTKNIPFSFMEGQPPLYSVWRYADSNDRDLVEIGNDVWIGSHVLIMDGVKIGDGAIVAAGAVVTKNVEPYSIVGGVPAKHIKYRFTEEQRKALLAIKWWEKDFEWVKEHYMNFQEIDKFLTEYFDKKGNEENISSDSCVEV